MKTTQDSIQDQAPAELRPGGNQLQARHHEKVALAGEMSKSLEDVSLVLVTSDFPKENTKSELSQATLSGYWSNITSDARPFSQLSVPNSKATVCSKSPAASIGLETLKLRENWLQTLYSYNSCCGEGMERDSALGLSPMDVFDGDCARSHRSHSCDDLKANSRKEKHLLPTADTSPEVSTWRLLPRSISLPCSLDRISTRSNSSVMHLSSFHMSNSGSTTLDSDTTDGEAYCRAKSIKSLSASGIFTSQSAKGEPLD